MTFAGLVAEELERLLRPVQRAVSITIDLDEILSFTPDLSGEHDQIVAELKQAFLNAYLSQDPNFQSSDATLQELASDWALERAGELITSITETTRDGVKEVVATGVSDGLSLGQVANALRDYTGFDRKRAMTIARTESAYALGAGQRAAAEAMGQDEKQWVNGECADCQANADVGWIGIDEEFADGSDNIPAHPNCTCTVIYRTRRVHETDEDTADDEEKQPKLQIVDEAKCPRCKRWVGRRIPVGSEVYCPVHKGVRIDA